MVRSDPPSKSQQPDSRPSGTPDAGCAVPADPFATFTEWSGGDDTAAFANLGPAQPANPIRTPFWRK